MVDLTDPSQKFDNTIKHNNYISWFSLSKLLFSNDENTSKYYFFGIVRCENTTSFSHCASEEEIDIFLN